MSDRRSVVNLGQQQPGYQDIAYAATITPDALGAELVIVGAITAAMTIAAPSNPFKGARLTIVLLQDGTGSFTVTLNAAFKATAPGSGTANQVAASSFVYDGATWVEVGGGFAWN